MPDDCGIAQRERAERQPPDRLPEEAANRARRYSRSAGHSSAPPTLPQRPCRVLASTVIAAPPAMRHRRSPLPCVTRDLRIRGWHEHAEKFGELAGWGADAPAILELQRSRPELAVPLAVSGVRAPLPYSGAEVVWAARRRCARSGRRRRRTSSRPDRPAGAQRPAAPRIAPAARHRRGRRAARRRRRRKKRGCARRATERLCGIASRVATSAHRPQSFPYRLAMRRVPPGTTWEPRISSVGTARTKTRDD